jgi:hypothetical protein
LAWLLAPPKTAPAPAHLLIWWNGFSGFSGEAEAILKKYLAK